MISAASRPNVSSSAMTSSPPPSDVAVADRQPAIERADQSSKSSEAKGEEKSGGPDGMEILKKVMETVESIVSSVFKMAASITEATMGVVKGVTDAAMGMMTSAKEAGG